MLAHYLVPMLKRRDRHANIKVSTKGNMQETLWMRRDHFPQSPASVLHHGKPTLLTWSADAISKKKNSTSAPECVFVAPAGPSAPLPAKCCTSETCMESLTCKYRKPVRPDGSVLRRQVAIGFCFWVDNPTCIKTEIHSVGGISVLCPWRGQLYMRHPHVWWFSFIRRGPTLPSGKWQDEPLLSCLFHALTLSDQLTFSGGWAEKINVRFLPEASFSCLIAGKQEALLRLERFWCRFKNAPLLEGNH